MTDWRSSANRGSYRVGHTGEPNRVSLTKTLRLLVLIVAIVSGLPAAVYYTAESVILAMKWVDHHIEDVVKRTMHGGVSNHEEKASEVESPPERDAGQTSLPTKFNEPQDLSSIETGQTPSRITPAPRRPAVRQARSHRRAEVPLGDAELDASDVYPQWLDHIHYIISPSERQRFLTLRTDSERARFIDTFWKKHDRPGYYRRLAFANRVFGRMGLAGWQTGQGHAYIAYGQPSDPALVDLDRSDRPSVYQNELVKWHYDYIQGLGANVTVEFDGDNGAIFRVLSERGEPQ